MMKAVSYGLYSLTGLLMTQVGSKSCSYNVLPGEYPREEEKPLIFLAVVLGFQR